MEGRVDLVGLGVVRPVGRVATLAQGHHPVGLAPAPRGQMRLDVPGRPATVGRRRVAVGRGHRRQDVALRSAGRPEAVDQPRSETVDAGVAVVHGRIVPVRPSLGGCASIQDRRLRRRPAPGP